MTLSAFHLKATRQHPPTHTASQKRRQPLGKDKNREAHSLSTKAEQGDEGIHVYVLENK